jgi:hypothetical protein
VVSVGKIETNPKAGIFHRGSRVEPWDIIPQEVLPERLASAVDVNSLSDLLGLLSPANFVPRAAAGGLPIELVIATVQAVRPVGH